MAGADIEDSLTLIFPVHILAGGLGLREMIRIPALLPIPLLLPIGVVLIWLWRLRSKRTSRGGGGAAPDGNLIAKTV